MPRVLLVNMPFSSLRWPALGISLLKAGLEREGIPCDVVYPNFDLAERIGLERYSWVDEGFGFVLGGERLFARHLFGDALPDDEAYVREVLLAADPEFSREDRRAFESLQASIGPFLDDVYRGIDWSAYDLVGFSTTFQQTMASLALARRIKQAHPAITIAFGGAHCEGDMGRALLGQFPWVDLVFSGVADRTFPEVVRQLRRGETSPMPCGVLGRVDRFLVTSPCAMDRATVDDLDTLPIPDFDDYFARLERSPLRGEIEPLLLFETARGCWWGARSHCTFCGLNGGAMAFRSKSPARALEELRALVERYGICRVCATDNILDARYLRSFLPMLREEGLGVELEYEIKPNLTREQVETLVSAGLRAAQLGIESLSTPVLKRLRKGLTSIQNIQTLKWMTAAGIEVKWNWLHGAPGETAQEYADLPELIRDLSHLRPPQAVGRLRIDRFSPYFTDPAAFGLAPPVPAPAYRFVYPFPEDVLARLAYYFQSPDANAASPPEHVTRLLEAIGRWQQVAGQARFLAREVPGQGLVLLDTRPGATAFQRRLVGLERAIYAFCDTAHSLRRIAAFVREVEASATEESIASLLDRWIAEGLMLHRDGLYLSLALQGPEPAARVLSDIDL